MIELYWDKAIGKSENGEEEFKFPEDPEKLSAIFNKIKRRDFSFLNDFYKKYGPEVQVKGAGANDLLREALIEYGRNTLLSLNKGEMKIMEAVKFYHELEKIMNDYKSHMQDWYDIYDPFSRYELQDEKFIKKILESSETQGINEDPVLVEIINVYKIMENLEKRVEDYIEQNMNENFPNLRETAGPILGAELILLSNGIKNLANSPAGRIQILGAGKAFYRARRNKVAGPKHGIIFKHPLVHSSRNRGKSARMLAGKIAIAARIDYYKGEPDREFLNKVNSALNRAKK